MSISEKDKIDGLKYISKIHRSQFDERRKIEWKIVFTVIAFYFGFITTRIAKGLNLIQYDIYFKLGISIVFMLLAIVTISYLAFIHMANHKNKSIAKNAENAIQGVLNSKTEKIDIFNFTDKKTWSDWSWRWQIVLLISIALCSILIISI